MFFIAVIKDNSLSLFVFLLLLRIDTLTLKVYEV